MIPYKNWNLQEGMKNFRNGKYLVNVKTISFSFLKTYSCLKQRLYCVGCKMYGDKKNVYMCKVTLLYKAGIGTALKINYISI